MMNTQKTQDDLLKEMVPDRLHSEMFRGGDQHPWLVPMGMPVTKIEPFKKQFPWIRGYINDPIYQVYVQGVDPDLIGRRLSWVEKKIDTFEGTSSTFIHEKIFLLDKDFKPVTSERLETYWTRKHRFLGIKFGSKVQRERIVHFDGMTTFSIMSALEELGEKGKLVQILLSYWEYTEAVIIYKLPKDDNLKDWVDREMENERAGFERKFNET